MNATDTQNWTEKVAKLLAKAERAGTPEEADAFFSKAQDIITRKGIDEAMLAAAGRGEKGDEVVVEDVSIKRSGYFKMMAQLWCEVASANSVRSLLMSPDHGWGERSGVRLIGWKSDIERVKLLATSLLLQCVRESKRDMPELYRIAGATKMAQWRRAFRMAYAVRVGQRLREQVELTKVEVTKETGNDKFLPALRDREAAVDSLFNAQSARPAKKSRAKYDVNGYDSGHSAANRADLGNTRVGNTRKQIG